MGRNWYIIAFCLLLKLTLGIADDSLKLEDIPDGFEPGRASAPYGAYSTPFGAYARAHSDFLDAIEPKVFGVHKFSDSPIKQAEASYLLEHVLMGKIIEILHTQEPLTEWERNALIFKAINLYSTTRTDATRLFQIMVRTIDIALPGPNGPQLRESTNDPNVAIYCSNCRDEKVPTEQEQIDFYNKRLAEFLAKGNTVDQMFELTHDSVKKFGTYTRLEYVERPDGSFWVTEGTAGHALLAEGKKVKAAGQIVFVKGPTGKVEFLVVSNASGTYKPDIFSSFQAAARLGQIFGVPGERIVNTQGEPMGSQTVKVLLKALKRSKAEIDQRVTTLESDGKNLMETPELHFNNKTLGRVKPNCNVALAEVASAKVHAARLSLNPGQ